MTKVEMMEMVVKLMIALAKRCLKDLQNEDGVWPMMQKWEDLAPSSQVVFMQSAREEAGVDRDLYLKEIRTNEYPIDEWWDEVEKDKNNEG